MRLDRLIASLACAAGILLGAGPPVFAQSGPTVLSADAKLLRDTVVSVSINGHPVIPSVPVVEVPGLGFAIGKADYDTLGLHAARPWMAVRGEEEYVVLNRVKGLSLSFDAQQLALAMQADISLFTNTRVQVYTEKAPDIKPASTGAYLNYDFAATSRAGSHLGTALLELVGFSPYGSLVSNHVLARSNETFSLNQQTPSSVRLDSYFQVDRPGSMQRFRLGDSISASSGMGRSVNFAGLKFGTDFSLNPNLVSMPLLQSGGSARVPSTVDLYVNGSLQRRVDVPAGPFTLDQIPVVTGNGNARIVIRDPQGREQIIEQPFYRTPAQLRPGLATYSVDLGALRKQYGLASNEYGERFFVGSGRLGLNDWLTGETRLEAMQSGPRGLGVGFIANLGAGHAFAPTFQWSQNHAAKGWGAQLGYSFNGNSLRLAAQLERYSADFAQVGFAPGELAVEQRALLSAGLRLGALTDLGFFLSQNTPRGTDRARIASLSLSHRLAKDWTVTGNVSHTLTHNPSGVATSKTTSGTVILNYVHDNQTSVSVGTQTTDNGLDRNSTAHLRVSRRPDIDGGWGAEIEVGNQRQLRLRGELLGSSGAATAEVAQFPNDSTVALRVSARGAVAAIGTSVTTSRRIEDSFILVRAPDAPEEYVMRGGRRYKLNAQGEAIMEHVQPYQQTRVAIVPVGLPLELEIGKAEERIAVPAKAGVVLNMNIRRNLPASFALLIDGKPPQSGSKVQISDKEFVVGLEGLVYIPDIMQLGGKAGALQGRFLGVGTGGANERKPAGLGCSFTLPIATGTTLIDWGEIACK
jgi:outer membrane usher protein